MLPLGSWLKARLIEGWLRRERRSGTPVRPGGGRGGSRRRARSRGPSTVDDGRLEFDADGRLVEGTVLDWSSLPADRDARETLISALEQGARRLAPGLRPAWVLCDVCGYDAGEAGEILDLSGAAVLSRLHRARLILRGAVDRGAREIESRAGEEA